MTGLTLPSGAALEVIAESGGWRLELTSDSPAGVAAEASRWLVDQLCVPSNPLPENGFDLLRLGRTPESPPAGERPARTGQAPQTSLTGRTGHSVVVGEQLVVTWLQRMDDTEHPALRAVQHLTEVGFGAVPATSGVLTWRSPTDRELPCAFVTDFLPGAVDGRQWCVEAVETGDRPGFPAELGLLAAGLHVALGSPSRLLPLPMLAVGGAHVRSWHAAAGGLLTEVSEQIGRLDEAPTGSYGAAGALVPSETLAVHHTLMRSVIDRLLDVPGRTPVQLIHGDLQVGQVLSRPGGLSVIGFGNRPVLGATAARQPAARDVAQLLLSLDQVGRIVDRRSGYTRTAEINAWSVQARAEFLAAYRGALGEVERRDVLDTRLLAAFLVEQVCRDLLQAVRFEPGRAHATLDGLETILTDLPVPDPAVTPQF